jgi:hypothetical protein
MLSIIKTINVSGNSSGFVTNAVLFHLIVCDVICTDIAHS